MMFMNSDFRLGSGEYADGTFDGIRNTADLLSRISDIELICKFAEPIQKKNAVFFIKVSYFDAGQI